METKEEDKPIKVFIPFTNHQVVVDGDYAYNKAKEKWRLEDIKAEVKAEKLKNTIKDVDSNEVSVGSIIISASSIEGSGVTKYKIVGETKTKWKVIYLSGDNSDPLNIKTRKIDKVNSVYLVSND